MFFAFAGEVIQGQVATVTLPDTLFRTIANVPSHSTDYIVTNLDLIGVYGLPAPAPNAPDATAVTTRVAMYLPAKYVPLLLSPSGYTIHQAWEILYPAIVNANDLINCAVLLKWLRAITTGTIVPNGNNGNNLGPTSAIMNLTVPLIDEDLVQHRLRLQKAALPGLYQPSPTFERAITQMAVAVTQNTNDSRLVREEKAARAIEPKLPSERFSVTINILQEFLQVADEALLPPLWHSWANCTKRQEFLVLTEQLQAYSRSNDAFSTCPPIASAKLVQDLLQFNFVGESADDIRSGIQPFIVADGSSEHRQANLELARTYGMLNTGNQSFLLSDLEVLKSKEVQSIPLSYFELERNLGMFGNLLGTVLGTFLLPNTANFG
jgi:hypothetical protein